MRNKHFDDCSAPLCQDSKETEAIWYPGEEVCLKRPYTEFQRVQLEINQLVKEGKFKLYETPLRALDLETRYGKTLTK